VIHTPNGKEVEIILFTKFGAFIQRCLEQNLDDEQQFALSSVF